MKLKNDEENLFETLSEAIKNNSFTDVQRAAEATLAKNIECFVAKYLLQHPDVDLRKMYLCYEPDNGQYFGYKFWISEKK